MYACHVGSSIHIAIQAAPIIPKTFDQYFTVPPSLVVKILPYKAKVNLTFCPACTTSPYAIFHGLYPFNRSQKAIRKTILPNRFLLYGLFSKTLPQLSSPKNIPHGMLFPELLRSGCEHSLIITAVTMSTNKAAPAMSSFVSSSHVSGLYHFSEGLLNMFRLRVDC